ncbi:hypothetical protein EDC01DRAFT_677514 [Geopyxis carbonaria]|nr:hypothetical protein EDC01DRAFT_677514 [Geopyxis carbonaria]
MFWQVIAWPILYFIMTVYPLMLGSSAGTQNYLTCTWCRTRSGSISRGVTLCIYYSWGQFVNYLGSFWELIVNWGHSGP